jgi:hypothetical protein
MCSESPVTGLSNDSAILLRGQSDIKREALAH